MIRMDDGASQHLKMIDGLPCLGVFLFKTNGGVQFFRREIAGPIVGDEDAAIQEDHVFKDFFLLSLIENRFVGRSQRVRVNFIETSAHLSVTGNCRHAVNRFQIGFLGCSTALEVKQGGGFEGKHSVG